MITLWMEGYQATGEHDTAQYCGTYKADTVADAARQWAKTEDPDGAYMNYHPDGSASYWGCRFFDNENDARKAFG